ncbi:hypothetical protein [Calothrix rhizosoleniae]|uniref:hypothetical protein n=1 Tax=Calothrix rhizosoleniae TaxID=888997 RepID=UPI000B4A07A9|nr:hypothetical protein [Calothrix rhizosoleniae]
MNESAFVIFSIVASIWVLMGIAGVIAILKTDDQKIKFGRTGLTIIVAIIVPMIITLTYATIKSRF